MTALSSTDSDDPAPALPGVPPPVLLSIWGRLAPAAQARLVELVTDRKHSAELLAHVLSDEAGSVSATTIRTYRRALQREGG